MTVACIFRFFQGEVMSGARAKRQSAGSAAAAAPKRRRVARVLSADAQELIIACHEQCKQDRYRKGRTSDIVASLLGVGHATVERVVKGHKDRVEAALAAGLDSRAVHVPPDEPEHREREPEVKEKHEDFVIRCISKMMLDSDLDTLPTVTSMYDFLLKERADTASKRHVQESDVFPFRRSTFHRILQRLGYLHKSSGDDVTNCERQGTLLSCAACTFNPSAVFVARGT